MPQTVKDKISAKLIGHKHSAETKQRISQGLKKAWSQIPQPHQDTMPLGFNNRTKDRTDETQTQS